MDENKKETEMTETNDAKKPENPNKITGFEIFVLFLIICPKIASAYIVCAIFQPQENF